MQCYESNYADAKGDFSSVYLDSQLCKDLLFHVKLENKSTMYQILFTESFIHSAVWITVCRMFSLELLYT